MQHFEKHVEGTVKYEEYLQSRLKGGKSPQSILTISPEKAQEIIETKAGTGIIKIDRKGNPKPQEQISCDFVIGKYFYQGEYFDTRKGTIHYSKKNAHLVPERGQNYD